MKPKMLTVAQVAERFHRTPVTIHRWIKDGIRLSDGTYLHLQAKRNGGWWEIEEASCDVFEHTLQAYYAPGPEVARTYASLQQMQSQA